MRDGKGKRRTEEKSKKVTGKTEKTEDNRARANRGVGVEEREKEVEEKEKEVSKGRERGRRKGEGKGRMQRGILECGKI